MMFEWKIAIQPGALLLGFVNMFAAGWVFVLDNLPQGKIACLIAEEECSDLEVRGPHETPIPWDML
jgi:hypothetical protein